MGRDPNPWSEMPAEPEAMTLDELRRRRDEVRRQEEAISYRRRLLHGQLDMLDACARASDRAQFESMLAEALSDGPATPGGAVRSVEVADDHDDVRLDPLPSDLFELSDEEHRALQERLQRDERETSERRRALLDELDALQDELVRRFRRDGVDARALLEGNG